jgi:pimeloyl-ACP methyl ester carboxylesterase
MDSNLIHKANSEDGVEIIGKVYGEGRPLVFLPPGPAECEQGWKSALPALKERFTCYLVNTRGRGLSNEHPDHSPERLVDDVLKFAESIEEPVTLVEWGSGLWAYVAAENHPAIRAVAVYEPGADEVMPDGDAEQVNEVFERVWALAAEDQVKDAAAFFIENSQVFYTDEDLATGIPYDFWQAAAVNLPIYLEEQNAIYESDRPSPMDPSILAKITVPVLLMQGTKTTRYFESSVQYVAEHVTRGQIRKIDNAGHFGPCIHPDLIGRAIEEFFENSEY